MNYKDIKIEKLKLEVRLLKRRLKLENEAYLRLCQKADESERYLLLYKENSEALLKELARYKFFVGDLDVSDFRRIVDN